MGKRTQAMILLAALLVGCAGVTDVFYGPDMTPVQTEDAVYQDAFAIGTMWAAKDPSAAADLVLSAQAVIDNMDDELSLSAYLNDAWVRALKKGDTEGILMMYAIGRLYGRLGITIDGPNISTAGMDKGLLYSAAEAFIDGVKSQR